MMQTKRLKLKELTLEDAYDILNWGKHEDDRFSDYNLSDMSIYGIRFWYKQKSKTEKQIYFSMRNTEGKLVGYIGLKEYNNEDKSAYLGIVIDPDEVNKGYGKESIKILIEYGFDNLKLDKIYLNVNNFNKRAISCYKSCGFKELSSYEEVFENQKIDIFDKNFDEFFVVKQGTIFSKNTVMVVERKVIK